MPRLAKKTKECEDDKSRALSQLPRLSRNDKFVLSYLPEEEHDIARELCARLCKKLDSPRSLQTLLASYYVSPQRPRQSDAARVLFNTQILAKDDILDNIVHHLRDMALLFRFALVSKCARAAVTRVSAHIEHKLAYRPNVAIDSKRASTVVCIKKHYDGRSNYGLPWLKDEMQRIADGFVTLVSRFPRALIDLVIVDPKYKTMNENARRALFLTSVHYLLRHSDESQPEATSTTTGKLHDPFSGTLPRIARLGVLALKWPPVPECLEKTLPVPVKCHGQTDDDLAKETLAREKAIARRKSSRQRVKMLYAEAWGRILHSGVRYIQLTGTAACDLLIESMHSMPVQQTVVAHKVYFIAWRFGGLYAHSLAPFVSAAVNRLGVLYIDLASNYIGIMAAGHTATRLSTEARLAFAQALIIDLRCNYFTSQSLEDLAFSFLRNVACQIAHDILNGKHPQHKRLTCVFYENEASSGLTHAEFTAAVTRARERLLTIPGETVEIRRFREASVKYVIFTFLPVISYYCSGFDHLIGKDPATPMFSMEYARTAATAQRARMPSAANAGPASDISASSSASSSSAGGRVGATATSATSDRLPEMQQLYDAVRMHLQLWPPRPAIWWLQPANPRSAFASHTGVADETRGEREQASVERK